VRGMERGRRLTRAGIGNLILIDRDIVELQNLQRQTLFKESDINRPKALAAASHLKEINSDIKIRAVFKDINHKNIESNIKGDLILDCTDNLETRFLLNEFSIENNIPWIFTSVVGSSGMLFNFIPKKTPCFKCIFTEPDSSLDTCDTEGIINTTASLLSSMQVTEAFKILTHQPYLKDLIHFDLWKNKLTKTKIKKLSNCETCKKNFTYLTGESYSDVIKICDSGTFQIKGRKLKLQEVAKKLKKLDKVTYNEHCLQFKELLMFPDGRTFIEAKTPERAKSIYTKYIGN
jgi:adenylyltransferase/sulfurtransferase